MSLLRPQSSLRLVRVLTSPSNSARWLSHSATRSLGEPNPKAIPDAEAMQATEDQASMIVAEHSPEGKIEKYHPEHQPDWAAPSDHGTSTFSPVPKRVMNGSEPGDVTPAAVLSGAPVDLQARTVRYGRQQPLKVPSLIVA